MKPIMGLVMGEVTPRDPEERFDSEDIFDPSAGIVDASAEVPSNKPAAFSKVRRVRSSVRNLDKVILIWPFTGYLQQSTCHPQKRAAQKM
jgi:hypothetical protein